MQIDPVDAAIDALVAYVQGWFDTNVGAGLVTVLRGWPDFATDTQGTTTETVRVAITIATSARSPVNAGRVHSLATVEGGTEVRYQVAKWRADAQIDVFTMRRDARDDAANRLDVALTADLPDDSGLTLTVSSYYDDRVRFIHASDSRTTDPTSAIAGRWRYSMTVRATGNVVVPRTYVTTTQIDTVLNGATYSTTE